MRAYKQIINSQLLNLVDFYTFKKRDNNPLTIIKNF